jgi:sensor histidine kinase YesM
VFRVPYRYLFIALLSVYSYLNIRFTVGDKLFDFKIDQIYLFAVITLVVFGVWELNRMVQQQERVFQKIVGNKLNPLITLFLLSMLNVLVASTLAVTLLDLILERSFTLHFNHFVLLATFGFRVNLFLNCINAIVYFMDRLKKSQLEAERFKQISMEAQFEALRSQINPHFLFNCFNVLSTLVYRDADASAKFIAQLSNVYRYLLSNQDKRVVPLQEELAFIDSYGYLLSIRFGENLVIENTVVAQDEFFIPPATIQMLIENAIKHNVASKKNPLIVKIFLEGKTLVITNNLQEKTIKEASTQIGLKNIQSRYEFLSDSKVEIKKTDKAFKVTIPLLQLEEA